MTTTPLVSVVMTAYNRETYIGEAIRSVLAQTFSDFELLIVDDASTDGTVAVARAWAAADPRVRVVVNERNLGDYPNRNRAAALARGQFLKYHDSDDVMYPHCLETMVRYLDAEPRAGFALSAGAAGAGAACPLLLTPRRCYQREFLGPGLFQFGPAAALFRTAAFRDLGGFPDAGAGADYRFWLVACTRTAALIIPQGLFWYRRHEAQELMSSAAASDYARLPGDAWRALLSPDCPLDVSEREQAKRNLTFVVLRSAVRRTRALRIGLAWETLRHFPLSMGEWLRYARLPLRDPAAGAPTGPVSGEARVPADPAADAAPRQV